MLTASAAGVRPIKTGAVSWPPMVKIMQRLELNLRHQADCPRVARENRLGVQEARISRVQIRTSGCSGCISKRCNVIDKPGNVLRVVKQVLEVGAKLEV